MKQPTNKKMGTAAGAAQQVVQKMTVDTLDPYRYLYTRLCGCGDIIPALGGEPGIGEKSALSDPHDPQFSQ